MIQVVLVIHLILAVAIIGLVLIQRSEGGGLGIGGGGGMGGFASPQSTANALTKATGVCAALFFVTSLTLAVMAEGGGSASIVDHLDQVTTTSEDVSTKAPEATDAPAKADAAPSVPVAE